MVLLRLLKNLFWVWRGVVSWGLLLAIVVVTWCVLQRNAIWEYLDTQEMRNKEKIRVEKLEHEIEQLQNERDMLSSSGVEHELVARETYRLSKPGEEILYLKMPSETKATTEETSASQKKAEIPSTPTPTPPSSLTSASLPASGPRPLKGSGVLPLALPTTRPAPAGR